ncbi:MAG TPA: hypothetical protein VH394_00125, partial [Thermoanaerobaculia bacterium]|nr:hypothetical protein [Thermoanaerobaculia bacterium]
MKLRPALLAVAFLLLTGPLANAASTASANTPPSSAEEGAIGIMTPVDGSSDCSTQELAFLNPAPSERAFGPCGTCSGVCAGQKIGTLCGYGGGHYYSCQLP